MSADMAMRSTPGAPVPEERVLSTLNNDGSRRWLRPRISRGRFLTARRIVGGLLILIFTAIPFIQLNGKPLILLDITTRHFTIFGTTFLPTDTLLLALFMVGVFVTIFLTTALLGRVWCGWACPQTVYMEFLFRPVERLFDGPPGRKTPGRFRGTGFATVLKYATFVLLSIYLANTFLAYFVGVDQLLHWVRQSPFHHPTGFLVMLCTTALMLFDFGFFREQTCILACPYGRFQSVLLDRQSLIISYDINRGEPRGKKQASNKDVSLPVASSSGDCVDCFMCVTTCPTGIDIREGLQMECIGCAQCIDACDRVMDKLQRPRGLIRYSSQAAMSGPTKKFFRPRIVVYPLILMIIGGLFGMALAGKGTADVTVLRGLGKPFTEISHGTIGNQVRIKIVNRTDHQSEFSISVSGAKDARLESEDHEIEIGPGESKTTSALVTVPIDAFSHGSCEVVLHVSDGREFKKDITYRLLGPGSAATPGAPP